VLSRRWRGVETAYSGCRGQKGEHRWTRITTSRDGCRGFLEPQRHEDTIVLCPEFRIIPRGFLNQECRRVGKDAEPQGPSPEEYATLREDGFVHPLLNPNRPWSRKAGILYPRQPAPKAFLPVDILQ